MPDRDPVQVIFVCWGNICRSPMAERVAERAAADAGLTGVRFTSAGTSAEERDEPMDPRAQSVLTAHGYRSGQHRAHRITRTEIETADLVIAMEDIHLRKMVTLAPGCGQHQPAHRLRPRRGTRLGRPRSLVRDRGRLRGHPGDHRVRHARRPGPRPRATGGTRGPPALSAGKLPR